MKRVCSIACLMGLIGCAVSSCSTDTHYDSISTTLSIDINDATVSGNTVKMQHRFQFDRDLVPLNSMTLLQAYISSPLIGSPWDPEDETSKKDNGTYSLSMIEAVSVSLIENDDTQKTFWLYYNDDHKEQTDAPFSEMSVGDLRAFMTTEMYLNVEFSVSLDPYQAMRYWRDVCELSDDCILNIPISMQFKMED